MAMSESQARRAAALEIKRGNKNKANEILAPFSDSTSTSNSTTNQVKPTAEPVETNTSNNIINDQLRQSDAYKNLISKGFSDQQIADRVSQMTPEQQKTIMDF